jgi:hypothetical protein
MMCLTYPPFFAIYLRFQFGMVLLVMFAAYALQVRFRPYMSPGKYDAVVLWHRERLKDKHPMNVKIDEEIQKEWHFHGSREKHTSGGRTKFDSVVANPIEALKKKNKKKIVKRQSAKISNAMRKNTVPILNVSYNGVEMIMLGSTVCVCLAGVCFQSLTSPQWNEARVGLTYLTIFAIVGSTIFFFGVCSVELFSSSCRICRREMVSSGLLQLLY